MAFAYTSFFVMFQTDNVDILMLRRPPGSNQMLGRPSIPCTVFHPNSICPMHVPSALPAVKAWRGLMDGKTFAYGPAKHRSKAGCCQAKDHPNCEASLEGCRTFHHSAERTARSMPIFRDREPYVKMRTRYPPFVLSGPMGSICPAVVSGLDTRPSRPSAFTCTLQLLRMS